MKKKKNPLRIFDTTLRDGHQSLFATRMRLDDILPLLEKMDEVGFEAMEVWGGATFDVCHRFLAEDPWERLVEIKKRLKKTPLQMLLRGQNLVGYKHYADDVVEAFVEQAADAGIDRFRVFDALNDERNFETSFKAIRKAGKHIQAAICYSLTERRLGGPIYNLDYYLKKAEVLVGMGADSLCIKDMAGILSPFDAFELVSALKKTIKVPIQLHCHYTSGMASMTYLKAIEAEVDIVDTSLAPFSMRTSQPAVEPLIVALEGTDRDTGLDLGGLFEIEQGLEKIAPKLREFLDTTRISPIDTAVLMHQVPGGMLSNMVNQLKQAGALDKIDEVYRELPKVHEELGSPPLVTPSSQIVGIQAVQNVLMGRYKMITNQVKDLCYGLYGKTPAPIDPDVRKLCLKGYEHGEKPIETRPADTIEPAMEKARKQTEGLAKNDRDVLIYVLFPTTGEKFLKWKYGFEPIPAEVKSASASKPVEKYQSRPAATGIPEKGPAAKTYNVFVGDEYFEVTVDEAKKTSINPEPPVENDHPITAEHVTEVHDHTETGKISEGQIAVRAPMNGLVIDIKVGYGAKVAVGDVLLIVEAMKMENQIKATAAGMVESVQCKKGANITKGDLLLTIKPD